MHYAVILTAGGLSTRLGLGIKKEFYTFANGKTVLSTCAESFLLFFKENPSFSLTSLIITLPTQFLSEGEKSFYKGETSDLCSKLAIVPSFISGGSTRQKSVHKALSFIHDTDPLCGAALIHDAARPYAGTELIKRVAEGVENFGACVPVIQSTDTQKRIHPETGMILDHLDRSNIVCVQTPQGFLFPRIFEAHNQASLSVKTYTDDAEIWADYISSGSPYSSVYSCKGEPDNIKITFSSDFARKE